MEQQSKNPSAKAARTVVLQGNEACAKAAMLAGCRFFAGYPITPSTEIIETLAIEMEQAGGVFIQMEDEIASACAAIGARWGGKKAMTATSGPGFSLMQEAIGYAASTETPLVIVDVQRGGPSTGQPTLSSQQDVYQARYGSHGDYEIICLAPSSVQEMYDFTLLAFKMSERFRTPVILLADEIVAHMREKLQIDRDICGIFPENPVDTASPGKDFFEGASTMVEGQLHDAQGRRIGHLASQSGQFVKQICEKITNHVDEISRVEGYYMEDADVAILAYGSVARPALNAVRLARGVKDPRVKSRLRIFKDLFKRGVPAAMRTDYSHLKVGLIKVDTLWPVPEDEIRSLAREASLVIVPEMNMGRYVREVQRILGDKTVVSMGKPGGEIHTPHELLDRILEEVGVREQTL